MQAEELLRVMIFLDRQYPMASETTEIPWCLVYALENLLGSNIIAPGGESLTSSHGELHFAQGRLVVAGLTTAQQQVHELYLLHNAKVCYL